MSIDPLPGVDGVEQEVLIPNVSRTNPPYDTPLTVDISDVETTPKEGRPECEVDGTLDSRRPELKGRLEIGNIYLVPNQFNTNSEFILHSPSIVVLARWIEAGGERGAQLESSQNIGLARIVLPG